REDLGGGGVLRLVDAQPQVDRAHIADVAPRYTEPVQAQADTERALTGDGVEIARGAVLAHLRLLEVVGRVVERPGEQAFPTAGDLVAADQVARAVGRAAAARYAVGRAEVAFLVALHLTVAAGDHETEIPADLPAGLPG